MHDPLEWKLYDTYRVHRVFTRRGHEIFMLVEKDYPLTKGLATLMLYNKIQVDQYSEMANTLMRSHCLKNFPLLVEDKDSSEVKDAFVVASTISVSLSSITMGVSVLEISSSEYSTWNNSNEIMCVKGIERNFLWHPRFEPFVSSVVAVVVIVAAVVVESLLGLAKVRQGIFLGEDATRAITNMGFNLVDVKSFLYMEKEMMCGKFGFVEFGYHIEVDSECKLHGVGVLGIGEVILSTFKLLQMLGFFLQIGFTLILATLDGLDVSLLGDVISEDECDEDE
ncbi:hypothetical protein Tco_0032787 [Tanacetum coccineum]